MARQRFVENISIDPNAYQKSAPILNEEVINVAHDSVNESYTALGVYTFPISRPDQRNLNNRIYTSELWENVIRSGKAENTFGLMNHPNDDGSVKDIWCVWKNLRFSPDRTLILADAYLIGHWGQLVLEALEAGGRIGLSSSGWGDFLEDNTTLDPDTFEIERVADFVFNPSYEVYGTQEGKKESADIEPLNDIPSNEAVVNMDSVLEQKKDSPKEENTEENIKMDENKKKSPTLEERSFILNIKSLFKSMKENTDVYARIQEGRNLLTYFPEGVEDDLKHEIEESVKADEKAIRDGYASVNELNESIRSLNEQITALQKEKEDLVKKNETLQEQVDKCCTLLDSTKEYSAKQEALYKDAVAEKNGMVTASEYKEAIVYGEELEEERDKLKRQINALRRQLEETKKKIQKLLKEKAKKAEDDDEDDDEEDDDDKDVKVDVDIDTDDDDKDDSDSDSDDDEDDEDDDKEESKKSKKAKKEGYNPDVVSYYEDLEYSNPKVAIIKEEILSKKTLMEAQKTYLKLRGLVEADSTSQMKLSHFGEKTYAEPVQRKLNIREGWV